jgi:hypothetical protein
MTLSRGTGILGWIPIDRERTAELDEGVSSRYWHDPDANRACPLTVAFRRTGALTCLLSSDQSSAQQRDGAPIKPSMQSYAALRCSGQVEQL